MIVLLLLAFLAVPLTAQATVFWDDELETGNSGYNLNDLVAQGATGAMTFDTSVKFSGSGSLRYNFTSSCYPDSSAQANCGGFLDRGFTGSTSMFRRVYVRLSSGFTVSDIFTKMFRSDTDSLFVTNWWVMGCCGSKLFQVHDQNVPPGDVTVQETSFTFSDATWYCVETEETLNTPGVSNGIARAWIDGVQVLNVTNVPYRQSGDTSLFNNNRMYRQTGLGNIWFDRLAVGDTRIGCLGGGGSTAGGGLDF